MFMWSFGPLNGPPLAGTTTPLDRFYTRSLFKTGKGHQAVWVHGGGSTDLPGFRRRSLPASEVRGTYDLVLSLLSQGASKVGLELQLSER